MASLSRDEIKEIYSATYELTRNRQYEDAFPLITRILEENPNDAIALNFLATIHLDMQNFTLSYQYARRALQEKPDSAAIWANFGLSAHELGRNDEAMSSYLKAIEIDNGYYKAYDNAAALLIEESKWDEAEKSCHLALDANPDDDLAKKNLAHVYLAKHNWKEGWKYWELSLGNKHRKEWQYGSEPRWDGTGKKTVVIYGEQGLGDEICYASCIPDAIRDCKKVIIDCDPRLEEFFKRSFPQAEVHGTRRDERPAWLRDAKIDARCAISSLPSIYRNADSDFPGTPYLKPNPELVAMFKAYFATLGKPVYGLCLHGGSKLTGENYRQIEPQHIYSFLRKDATFVSLDYKNKFTHYLIKTFPFAAQAKDYDITAALIASLDAVIGVNTTAMHCANGLGIPTHMLITPWHQWRYEGEYLWSKTAKLYHKGEKESWIEVINRVEL